MNHANNKIIAMACVVINKKGEILLLKRAMDKKISPGKWFVVGAAPLREDDDMEQIAHREMKDEIGVDGKIISRLDRVEVYDRGISIITYPFLAIADRGKIALNDEHTEYRWVNVGDLDDYDLIQGTAAAIRKLFKNI